MGMDPAAAAAGHPGTGLSATAWRSTQVVRLCQFRVVLSGAVRRYRNHCLVVPATTATNTPPVTAGLGPSTMGHKRQWPGFARGSEAGTALPLEAID